jgi:predicted metalloendopeptidase
VIDKRNEQILKEILECSQLRLQQKLSALVAPTSAIAPTASPVDADEVQLGRFYSACMNTNAIRRKGLKPLQPIMERIAKVRSVEDAIREAGGQSSSRSARCEPSLELEFHCL